MQHIDKRISHTSLTKEKLLIYLGKCCLAKAKELAVINKRSAMSQNLLGSVSLEVYTTELYSS